MMRLISFEKKMQQLLHFDFDIKNSTFPSDDWAQSGSTDHAQKGFAPDLNF